MEIVAAFSFSKHFMVANCYSKGLSEKNAGNKLKLSGDIKSVQGDSGNESIADITGEGNEVMKNSEKIVKY